MKLKNIGAFLAISVSFAAFGRTVDQSFEFDHGPYVVPVRSEAFNPVGGDFLGFGEALLLTSQEKMFFQMDRTPMYALTLRRDSRANNYLDGFSEGRVSARIGLEGEQVSYFFAKAPNYLVSTTPIRDGRLPVSSTRFRELSREKIEQIAESFYDRADSGTSIEHMTLQRNESGVVVTADVSVLLDSDDEPTKVGQATFRFVDGEHGGSIQIHAEISGNH